MNYKFNQTIILINNCQLTSKFLLTDWTLIFTLNAIVPTPIQLLYTTIMCVYNYNCIN